MIQNIFYFILALIGLGFLIFIHELGHYFMARRAKMTVEVFSIGFGKALFEWNWHGVQWQISVIPFGGYVRIKGMERKKGVDDLYKVQGGYYSQGPWKRIMVAVMGPLVNLVFAVLAFSCIWMAGGREKPFADKTGLIGLVDRSSKLHEMEIQPGDQLNRLNGRLYDGFEDLLYAAILDGKEARIEGNRIDYYKGSKEPFDLKLPTYSTPSSLGQNVDTMGILNSASYLIYNKFSGDRENKLVDGSPMQKSGIQYKDRIIWANGSLVFSQPQLSSLVNQPKALITVKRGDDHFVTVLPRLKVADMQLSAQEAGELEDWHHAAVLTEKVPELYFIPYNLTSDGTVEKGLTYLGKDANERTFTPSKRAPFQKELQPGDRIVAVNGAPTASSAEILKEMQHKRTVIIVQHKEKWPVVDWKKGDDAFLADVNWPALEGMINSIGTEAPIQESGNLRLLKPVTPIPLIAFDLSPKQKEEVLGELEAQRKAIEAIKNPKEKEHALTLLEKNQKKLLLGITLQDHAVNYNPGPLTMTAKVFAQIGRTFTGLFTGSLKPKQLSGPVGIIQVIHYGWTVGFKEALYWLGLISLNLGVLNLLPLPVLDGGHICFSLYEVITRKKVNHKVVERIIIPFFILLVIFFVYMMYTDVSRLFGR